MHDKHVITGIGMVGPFGVGNDRFWRGIADGVNFLRPVTRYPFSRLAGEVPDFTLLDYVNDPRLLRTPRTSQYAVASAALSIADAGLDWKKFVETDPRYFRPLEPNVLVADSTKAKKMLNWAPLVKFKDLVRIMVDADMRKAGLKPVGEGDAVLKRILPNRWWGID